MTLHVHRVASTVRARTPAEVRWCFYCRRRVMFFRSVHVPIDPMSYYGPHEEIRCEHGHWNGDCFPGRHRWNA